MTRIRRRTARAAATAAASALLLAGAGTATATATASGTVAATAASAASGDVSVFGGLEVKVVQPYEPVDISETLQMGLLPQGKQNYVVSHPDRFAAGVEYAKGLVGDDIRPDSMSLGVSSENGEVRLITGAWRLAEAPREIRVTFGDDDWSYLAQIVQLPGSPGWGTYYFDVERWDLTETSFTVEGVDEDGEVFDTLEHQPWPQG
ncbi:hypothetical protein V1J52_10485 [Streptomyces sp. TRM 70351]|uniref:hypothetical protein n=1 Tax=Streptomyces sp. TRM 70351 TaxID=3116552 RepID=UPI002E7B7D84|nr:hypothetical protein [Streptomyces sp. TRM 70351]MEE1928615.1 hypothetical protein [Streptomyces sp. TRM 70351]